MARIKVAVTGAGGQIGYATVFRLVSGEIFGKNTKVDLNLVEVDVPEVLEGLKGLAMEINDCGYDTLGDINIYGNPVDGFKGANVVLMIGAKPRGPGMERADLLKENGKIFVGQGQALNGAAPDVRVFVVGNPANTNTLIAWSNSDLCPTRFQAMTMLDQNRARNQIAVRAGVNTSDVKRLSVFGNHSPTMVLDFENALVCGKPLTEVITNRAWLEGEFTTTVQQRGGSVIKARGGKSSAASAANACLDMVKNTYNRTCPMDVFSAGVMSTGKEYGVQAGIICSFPLQADGFGNVRVVDNFKLTPFLKAGLDKTVKELLDEKEAVKEFLKR